MIRKEFDIFIKNAVVYDPFTDTEERRDILTKRDRIVRIPEGFREDMAVQTFDARGLYLVPSLTENHAHIFFGGGDCNINPDVVMIPSGITNAVDQGSSGWSNFPLFRKQADTSMMNLKCYLNVSNSGLITEDYYENINPSFMREDMIKNTVDRNRDVIIGLKIRLCRESVLDMKTAPLERALEIAERLSLPVSVHIKDLDCIKEYSFLLRNGDTWVHVFQNQGQTIFDEKGRIRKCVTDAREKGVLFDIAGGRSSFSYEMIRNAKKQGFEMDFIGTDLVSYNVYQRPLFSMINMMNVYLNLGFSLYEVIRKVTVNPALTMNTSGKTDTLRKGSGADLFLFDLKEKEYVMKDNHGGEIKADRMMVPVMTVKDGRVLYNLRRRESPLL